MSEASKAAVVNTLKGARSVVISVHTRPDGDAIGSQLGLGLFLEAAGKDVLMLNADGHPYNMDWLPGSEKISKYDGRLGQLKALAGADVIVVADTNAVHRIGDHGKIIREGSATTILIDHHPDPENWYDMTYRRESASSTGELIFEILSEWDADLIDDRIATSLYTAIMTDTGSFRYSNVTPELHHVAAELIQRGQLDVSHIHAEVYDKRSPEGIRLMGRILDTLDLRFEGQLGMMAVTRSALADTGAPVEETDGIANQILSIEGVRVALLLTETERGTKISFRSKSTDHVHSWARSLGGGGHRNASGAFVHKSLDETIRIVVESAPRFISFDVSEASDTLSDEDTAYLSALLEMKNKN